MSPEEQISFTLMENGLDFILRSLEYLTDDPDTRSLKYAVLHLHSGIELILKERLRREHWALVFEKPDEANMAKYEAGDFVSVQWKTCLSRLQGICKVDIPEDQRKLLEELKKKRNRLEHFGIVDTVLAVKGSTVPVLAFALDFINDEIGIDQLSESEVALLQQIRRALGNFQDFVSERTRSIAAQLDPYGKSIVTCPRCMQDAMVIDDGALCYFCGHRHDDMEAAIQEFVHDVLEIDWHTVARGGEWPVYTCPGCGIDTLVDLKEAEQEDKPRFICFYCGNHWDWGHLIFCSNCGQPYEPNGMAACDDCFEWSLRRND